MSEETETERRVEQLAAEAREAGREGLVVSTSGNFSVRLDRERFAISAARTRLAHLQPDELVVVDIAGSPRPRGASSESSFRPSRETPMHRAVYAADPSVGSLLHCQSPFATLLACRGGPVDLDFIPEYPVYVRKFATVPYLPPGSEQLATAVSDAFSDPDVRVVQLGNHGQIVRGDSPPQCVERAVFFELACRIHVASEPGPALRRYSAAELDELRSY